MTRFPTAKHLASWAGTTPGQQRVRRPGQVQPRPAPATPTCKGALGAAAMSCAQNPRTYLGARYRRIAARRGPQKANVAIQHSMLTAIWHMGTTGALYDDPGSRLLHPPAPRTRQETSHPPTRSHGLPRHPRPRELKLNRPGIASGAVSV